jgi:hypothetical protein
MKETTQLLNVAARPELEKLFGWVATSADFLKALGEA